MMQPLGSAKMVARVYCRLPSVKWLLSCSRGLPARVGFLQPAFANPLLNVKCRLRRQFAETRPAATGEETVFRIQMASSTPGLNVSEVSTFFLKAEVRPAVCGKTHYYYCISSLKRLKFIGCPVVVWGVESRWCGGGAKSSAARLRLACQLCIIGTAAQFATESGRSLKCTLREPRAVERGRTFNWLVFFLCAGLMKSMGFAASWVLYASLFRGRCLQTVAQSLLFPVWI